MGQTTGFLTKALTATTAIPKRTFVKYGAADGTGVPATDGSACIVGVSDDIDTAIGERCSTFMAGNIKDIVYGGNVTRGQSLTADAQGRAVAAAPGAGTDAFCGGFAEVSGVAGDIGSVVIAPHVRRG